MWQCGPPGDGHGIMTVDHAICERCGAEAHVHITSEHTGATGIRHLCFACVELERAVRKRRKRAFNLGAVFMVLGGLSLLLCAFADYLSFGDSQGFGIWQMIGLVVAVVLTGVGAALRIPTVLVLGPCIGLLALLADQLGLGDTPGFGRQQVLGCFFSVLLILLGLLIVVMRKRWAMRIQALASSGKAA